MNKASSAGTAASKSVAKKFVAPSPSLKTKQMQENFQADGLLAAKERQQVQQMLWTAKSSSCDELQDD